MRRGGRVQTRLKPAGVLHLGDDPAKSAKRLKEEQFCGETKSEDIKVKRRGVKYEMSGIPSPVQRPSENGRPFLLPPSRTTVDLMRGPSDSSARCTLPSIVVRNDGMLAMARSPTDL
ncbi:hypothetical protein V1478_014310 [Vespula squamosa]|uniref:Uncharacterized protein n=1 Tax=Vespula squamosa TaxID=30214 RepID=A0ABD2A7P4_VESSQ